MFYFSPTIALKASVITIAMISLLAIPVFADNATEVAIMLAGISCLASISLPLFGNPRYQLFEPISMVIPLVAIGVTLKICYILAVHDFRPYVQKMLLIGKEPGALLYGTLVSAAGLFCLSIGYLVPWPGISSVSGFLPKLKQTDSNRVFGVSFCLLVVSFVFLILFAQAVGLGFGSLEEVSAKRFSQAPDSAQQRINSLVYYFYRLAAFSKFAFYLPLAWVVSGRSHVRSGMGLLMIVSFAQTTFLFFAMQSRASVCLLVIDAVLFTCLIHGGMRWSRVLILTAIAMLLIPMAASRDRVDRSLYELVEKCFMGRDLMDIAKTCHIINAVPEQIPYRYGETLIGWTVAPIPSSIWPSKPLWAERGPYLMYHVFGDQSRITGIPPGIIAELYWNLGIAGVLGGMFLMGTSFRVLLATFLKHHNDPLVALLYVIGATRFVMFTLGNDLGTGILKAVLDLLPLVAITWMVVVLRVGPSVGNHQPKISVRTGNSNLAQM